MTPSTTELRSAGLRYATDAQPGIRRVKAARSFRYVAADGKPIRDPDELARIRALAIPPAYTDVWIAPDPDAHLQATGRDARGRKQYRYHKRWREIRDETKFDRMLAFAKALPAIRAAVKRDLARPGLPREKVVATVVALLEATLIRVGNEEYARANDSYGLTTLREEHVRVRGDAVRFCFRGKSGKEHDVTLRDPRLARVIRACQDLPGHELFSYVDAEGRPHSIGSADVNAYLRAVTEGEFTAKDMRTWEGTMACALALAEVRAPTPGARKRAVNEALGAVAAQLRNTPAVCRKSYVHPGVLDEFLATGALELAGAVRKRRRSGPQALSAHEAAVVAFIERIARRDEGAHLTRLLQASVRRAAGRGARRSAGERAPRRPRRRSRAAT